MNSVWVDTSEKIKFNSLKNNIRTDVLIVGGGMAGLLCAYMLEKEGVDFWWIDWQQGTKTKIPGLDPLWALNHYHTLDSAKNGSRPLTLSRYSGLGSHRFPLGFSGDTICSWKSLKFQPYFTGSAANAGYTWWSHDIGGHMHGIQDDEL